MTDRHLRIVGVVVLGEPKRRSGREGGQVLTDHHTRHVVGALVRMRAELAVVGAAPGLKEHGDEHGSGGDACRGRTHAVSRQAFS